MKSYCLSCRKYAVHFSPKKVTMTNKVVRAKSKCANCMANKSRFLKQKHNKKAVGIILILNFSYIKNKSL